MEKKTALCCVLIRVYTEYKNSQSINLMHCLALSNVGYFSDSSLMLLLMLCLPVSSQNGPLQRVDRLVVPLLYTSTAGEDIVLE